MITVRELEKELNVSRVSIYALLKKDPFKKHVVKGVNDVIMINDTGAAMLKSYYQSKIRGGKPRSNIACFESDEGEKQRIEIGSEIAVDAEELDVIGVLQQQLAKKDEQIDNLINIISNQHEIRI